MNTQSYWDQRAQARTFYKGEYFYTITPLPYYVARRKILLDLFSDFLEQPTLEILDFGCGDGWYTKWAGDNFPQHKLTGTDISAAMLESARKLNPGAVFVKAETLNQIPERSFDLIYSFAVFAHIPDDELQVVFQKLSKLLRPGGRLITFDQVSTKGYQGTTFFRRKFMDYVQFSHSVGLSKDKSCLVDFPLHRYFEMNLLKWYRTKFCKAKSDHARRIEANSHQAYRFLSKLGLYFSLNPVRDSKELGWGYGFFAFRKNPV